MRNVNTLLLIRDPCCGVAIQAEGIFCHQRKRSKSRLADGKQYGNQEAVRAVREETQRRTDDLADIISGSAAILAGETHALLAVRFMTRRCCRAQEATAPA